MYNSLKEFIQTLRDKNQLLEIKEKVNTELEIAEITDRISKSHKGGKALIFFNTDFNFPVLTNMFGSDERMALALGTKNLKNLSIEIENFIDLLSKPPQNFSDKFKSLFKLKEIATIFPKHVKKGKCQEIIHKNPDLNILPVLKTWPKDAGRFITLPMVHTIDPLSGIRNVGMYRLQIFDSKTTGMHWHKHKVGARHFSQYKKLNKKMPIAVALGGDPVYTYCATAPLPDNIDEYLLAGFLRKKPVKLVKCITQDIEVPADADFVIEGYIDPQEDFTIEGPFGDHTGFYSLADYYPKFHVTCITHRKDAIYPATLVGIPPQEDAYIAKATERIFLPLIKKTIAPEIVDMNLPEAGVAHNFTIVKIKKRYEGQVQQIASALWGNGQMALNKCLFITDNDEIEIDDYKKLAQKLLINFRPNKDLIFSEGPLDVLDHSSNTFTFGSKVAFDLTNKNSNFKITKIETNQILYASADILNVISLLDEQIPILILTINKTKEINHYVELIRKKNCINSIKIVIFIDRNLKKDNLYHILWYTGSNIDPKRDFKVIETQENSTLFIDATEKNKDFDKFKRQWPEIITMDKKTIAKIDEKWEKLNIGNFIKSPSLMFYENENNNN